MTFSIAAIFAAGLLTFASPCVLPLMPIYLATIAGGRSGEKAQSRRTLSLAFAFTLGLGATFITLGALAASVGKLLITHRTAITVVSGALMVLFGLRSLGLLRIALLDRDVRPGLQRVRSASSHLGAGLFGAAFALGWSPCIGPVLAAVLTYAAAHSETPWRGAGYLGVYAAGLGLPMLVLAGAAGQAGARLKPLRRALPKLEKLTGLAMAGIGLWTLGSVLAATPTATVASAGAAAECSTSVPGTNHTCALPQADNHKPSAAPDADVALAAHQGQIAGAKILEFSSRDCPVCRRMRPVVDKLVSACSELDSRLVRVDVTTAHGRALAEQHGVRGTPTFVLLDDTGTEKERLLGENTGDDLAAAVERAFGLSCSS